MSTLTGRLGRAVICTALIGAVLTAAAGPASATVRAPVAGTFAFLTDVQTVTSAAAGNLFIAETATLRYSGGLVGQASDVDSLVVHADGTFEGSGTEVCADCTLGGRTGDFIASFVFRGSGDFYTGRETIISSSGGLSGLHSEGTFAGQISTNTNTYLYDFGFAT